MISNLIIDSSKLKSRLWIFLSAIILLTNTSFCQSAQEQIDQNPLEKQTKSAWLERIKNNYVSNECVKSNFQVQTGGQRANGALRVDDLNKRIRLIFTEPMLGITLSWVTIQKDVVYLSNPRERKPITVPLEGFIVTGPDPDSLRLPYRVFESLLYGRLPAVVYETKVRSSIEKDRLRIDVSQAGERIVYYFDQDYLREMDYEGVYSDVPIKATLSGNYRKSKFPLRIDVVGASKQPVSISTTALDMNARCSDTHFPIQ